MDLAGYVNLDLRIEREQGRYRARIIDSPAGQAVSFFDLPFSPLELENFLLRIGRGRGNVRRLESSQIREAKDFGGRLFNAVFSGDVRACLRSSLATAESQAMGLRIRLNLLEAPELINAPWEFAYDSTVNRFLTLSTETPVVRYMDLPERVRPLTIKPPLRILVMIASPSDYPPLQVADEWAQLQSALVDLKERGLVTLQLMPEASLTALNRALRRGEYHIFHFVGHGVFDVQAQDGLLMMVDETGRGFAVSGQSLGTLLHDHRSLRLAVVNACEGARSTAADPFAGAGQSLVQQGLPAVIAMQFEISNQAAIVFSHEFYSALAEGYAVDTALAEARKALYAQTTGVEWATPVLYLRAPDGRIFDIASITQTDLGQSRQISTAQLDEARRKALVAALAANAQAAESRKEWLLAVEQWQSVVDASPNDAQARERLSAARQKARKATIAPDSMAGTAPTTRKRTQVWTIGGAGIFLVLALLAVFLPRILSREGSAGSSYSPPSAGAFATLSATATPPVMAMAGIMTPTVTATTSPATPTPTLKSVNQPLPTSTPSDTVPPSQTPTSTPTSTPTITPSTTPTKKPAAGPPPTRAATLAQKPSSPAMLVAPVLEDPQDGTATSGPTTFAWEWRGPALSENQGFEIRLWKDGQPDHYGAAAPLPGTVHQAIIDLRGSYGWQQGGDGHFRWTVATVQREPYRRIGLEASPRAIDISTSSEGPTRPAAPTIVPP